MLYVPLLPVILLGVPDLLLSGVLLLRHAAGVGVLKLGLCDVRSGLRSGLPERVAEGLLLLLVVALLLLLAVLLLRLASGKSKVLVRDVWRLSLRNKFWGTIGEEEIDI